MNAVWLASWYPNRTNISNGDFIERHAKAVAPFLNSLIIISAVKDEALPFGTSEVRKSITGNITTYLIYYGRTSSIDVFEPMFSTGKYLTLHRELFKKIVLQHGKPDIVHVHVAMKAGLFAKEIKRKYGIPYVVTEQWTGYFKIAKPNIYSMGFMFRQFTKLILKRASLLLPVSNYLGETISKEITRVKYVTVPNVVDTSIFFPIEHTPSETLQLVHISVMGYQKNMEAMVEALDIFKKEGGKFLMQVFGPSDPTIVSMVQRKQLDREIIFKGEVTQPELAPAIQAADALLLYSRYETFGCVLVEANACGVPVIVSDFPVFHEFIKENENGVFAEGDKPAALAAALKNFYANRKNFDRETIAAVAKEKFRFDTVGKMIKDVYDSCVG